MPPSPTSPAPTTVQLVPIEKIRILNARSRSRAKFRDVADNIGKVGLKKPITVSRRERDDGFDLVCGQGRLEAWAGFGATEIPALVVDVPEEERLLRSLVENLTRRKLSSLGMARELSRLEHEGHGAAEIAQLVGLSERYVADLLRLLDKGEERLVAAVEHGDIPISVAVDIASCDDAKLQRALQEGYESGSLRGRALTKARRLVEERRARGKGYSSRAGSSGTPSAHDLVRALRKEAHRQELLVRKARLCEQQLRFVLSALKELLADEHFVTLLRAEKLDGLPKYLREMVAK